MIKLSKVIANDLNQIAATLIEENQQHSDGFNLDWFKRNRRPDLKESYLNYLLVIIQHYNQKHSAEFINIEDGVNLNKTASTSYFLKQGGYVAIYDKEESEEDKSNLELQQLKTNVMLLVSQLADYDKFKKMTKCSLVVSILALLSSAIVIWIELRK